MPDTLRDQMEALVPLGLELQMVVSYHVGSGNNSRIEQCSLPLSSLYPDLNCYDIVCVHMM